jgi:hypothetical protein
MSVLSISRHDGGWLVSGDDAPIGFINGDGAIHTPSGAAYTVRTGGGRDALVAADGRIVVTLGGDELRDEVSAVVWRLRDDWRSAWRDGTQKLDEIWALPYTREDAQGTVPNRVRLLLAWVLTRSVA